MSTATHPHAADTAPLALELHLLLRDLDPARRKAALEATIRERIRSIEERVSEVVGRLEGATDDAPSLRARWTAIGDALRDDVPSAALPRKAWDDYRQVLQFRYEALCQSLKALKIELPELRPTNYTRSLWHMLAALSVVVVIEKLVPADKLWLPPLAFALFAWFLETLRRVSDTANDFMLKMLASIAHPRERYRVNSTTWYGTALLVLALAFDPMLCALGVIVLGIADPAAALVGRSYGRTKLIHGRSLEGSTAFFVVGAVAGGAVLAIFHPMPFGRLAAVAAAGALCGAVAELLSGRVDDNFSIPIATAVGGWAALALLG